jgi:hypothetical protein
MSKEEYNKYGFRPLHPDDARIGHYPIKTGQTLAVGDPVILDSGQVAVAVAASSTELLGVIAEPCSSKTAGDLVAVWDDPDTLFQARVSADASSVAIGYHADLSGTTGEFEVNVSASSQDLFTFMGCLPSETSSTAGALCKVRINKHALADISS